MGIDTSAFKVTERAEIDLGKFDTKQDGGLAKENSRDILLSLKEQLAELQDMLYADNSKSLLIIFQAMDAAGKDSAIKHVMSGVNPQGCQVYSFKQPNSEELDHDFLWRHYKALPERGRIGIHNRSHYENVLVCKVHPKFAANESKLPLMYINEKFWNNRYRSIRNFEEHLTDSGTTVIKFYLHISKEEQKERFLKRIDDPSKNWKFSASDIDEREMWDHYMKAYKDVFRETSTETCPWYIIPSDKKWFARIAICQIIVDTLRAMDLKYPILPESDYIRLAESKKRLQEEKD
ncbi:polyphosphate kinase 2 family protein [Desertivirga brevis]|uniref:polyphosphate kinase 2 family protein n=1 Tax=Desertivirga brevis TaxID=2810310 RepID=UPI001A961A7E|nr:polyphosphate kinase 2 family protein [Pedobacter sp. SYSU D00873]